jgi:hypothetical protein
MNAWKLRRKKFHFPPLVVVDLIKQVAYDGVWHLRAENLRSQYLGHGGENIIN